MKRLVGLLAMALVAISFGLASPAVASSPKAARPVVKSGVVPGQYIVTLKSGVKPAGFLASNGIATKNVYDAALNGFSAKLSLGQLAALKRSPNVVRIEQDQYISLNVAQSGATWGIDRIDQRNLPLSTTYNYNSTATNVTAYVIDTGIQTSHPQFGGRASVGYDALGGTGQDCNGHGTHVAGTIGSATYGVAKGVKLVAVRVLDCNGSGSWTQVINGMNWVANNHATPAVANMSLGGSIINTSVDDAATNMVNTGVTVAVAAGNSNADASTVSPARASGVITVAASDQTDHVASFSNHGGVVELYAPGVNITSTWLNSGTNTISGTSMASPHVAGVAALYLAYYPTSTPETVSKWIVTYAATTGVLIGVPADTPNRLLYKSTL